jgi:branched-chain amino acid transport system substrate-binding protein
MKRFKLVTMITMVVSFLLPVFSSSSVASASSPSCGKQLTIGIDTDFTGDLGSFGQTDVNGFQLAVSQINSSHALPAGWVVKTKVSDAQGKSTVAIQLATQMIQAEHASFIVGPASTEIVGMVNLAARYKVPIISQFAGTITLNTLGGKWIYRTIASDAYDGKAAALWLYQQHAKSIVVLIGNDQSTVSVAHTTQSSLTGFGGSVKKSIMFTPGQSSYQATVADAIAAQPGYIFLAGGQADGTTIVKELRNGGYKGPILVSSDMVVPQVLSQLGSSGSQKLYGEEPVSDVQAAAYKLFARAYTAKFHSQPGLFSANSYDAVMLGVLSAVAAKSTCGSAINSKIYAVANPPGTAVSNFKQAANILSRGGKINYEGASGTINLDKSGTAQGAYAIVLAQSGNWHQVKFYSSSTFK